MHRILFLLITIALLACGGNNRLAQYYNAEDKQLFETLDKLKKDPGNKTLQDALQQLYTLSVSERNARITSIGASQGPGEKWVQMRKQYEVGQQLYEAIIANPAALNVIRVPASYTGSIEEMRRRAAEDYYNQGAEYLTFNNRQYAQMAYDAFAKASEQIPNYKDVNDKLRTARDLATIKVVVNTVDYYRQPFSYWGLNNDYLQYELVRSLNARSYNNVQFFTDEEARLRYIHPDRVVALDFTNIFIGNPYNERSTYTRQKQIETGQTKTDPPRPVYTNISATVTVIKRVITGSGSLQCRIYDVASGRNILYDQFPGRYSWVFETATYTGDNRALLPEDWQRINNRFNQFPNRQDIARKIIDDSYFALNNRIQQGVTWE